MNTLVGLLLWCVLFVLCWPVALAALVLWPLAWLLTLPFRLLGLAFDALFATLRALLFLPARLLGEAMTDRRWAIIGPHPKEDDPWPRCC